MSRELLLLRHAKSDWSQGVEDFDRPLNVRGQNDAAHIGRWAHQQGLHPDRVFSSPAQRAAQTAAALCAHIGYPAAEIAWDTRIYLASIPTLLEVLADIPADIRLLVLIGHNPGLEDLLVYLTPAAEQHRRSAKLLTTAALAQLEFSTNSWTLQPNSATLRQFIRPRDLHD